MSARTSFTSFSVFCGLIFQWLYNGFNYVAFKTGAGEIPPFLLSAARFSIAALVVSPLAVIAVKRNGWPGWPQILHSALCGLVMLVFSQAVVLWGVNLLPAGTSAVFASSAPLFIVLFAWGKDKVLPSLPQMTGVVIGFAGIALLAFSSHQNGQNSAAGIFAILISTASWAFGAVFLTRSARALTGITGLFIQFLAASLVLWATVAVSGEMSHLSFTEVSTRAWWSLGYLVLISSVCGYAVFIWLSHRTSPAVSNSFFYVAPVVAMVAAAFFFSEPLTEMKMMAAGISLFGVILIVSRAGGNSQGQ